MKKMKNEPKTILCSSVTLGTYIPALLLHHTMLENGVPCEIIALEQLFSDQKQSDIPKLKQSFHQNFKLAKVALKMAAKTNTSSFDENIVSALLSAWHEQKRHHFIIFTGFWSEVINCYLSEVLSPQEVQIDLVHMDAGISPSWKSYESKYGTICQIKPFDPEQKMVACYIPPNEELYNFHIGLESNKILIHGGGWGIGTYREIIEELIDQGFQLNVVAYETGDVELESEKIQYHLLDPLWVPCNDNSGGGFTFPQIAALDSKRQARFKEGEYYPYYQLVKDSSVIISKPGGGTLNDSISSGTPIVFLEAFGEHELINAQLWKELGYGIDFETWKTSGYSMEVIDRLRENLKVGKKKTKTLYQLYYGIS